MARIAKIILSGLLLVGGSQRAKAFSLLGPFEAWQVQAIGYNIQAQNFIFDDSLEQIFHLSSFRRGLPESRGQGRLSGHSAVSWIPSAGGGMKGCAQRKGGDGNDV